MYIAKPRVHIYKKIKFKNEMREVKKCINKKETKTNITHRRQQDDKF
jgi:hypothetical protein